MKPIRCMHFGRAMMLAAIVAFAALSPRLEAQTIPPLPARGPNPVGCTNVEQDLSRVPQGETAEYYWRGISFDETERYVTSLLVDREHSLVSTFTAPNDPSLFGQWSGTALTYVVLVCYPTTAGNTRSDYTLPRGVVVPRMQRGGEAPILPSSARLPVLLYSHGYGGSPLSGSYLDAIVAFASWGYVVVAPFHGDFRYSVFGPDFGGSEAHYIPIWTEFVAMQATRPLSMSAALDLVSAHEQWRDHVDLDRVGAFGISQGGETIMLLGGAALTHVLFTLDAKRVTLDSRVRAAVGYVPYFGIHSIPAFGDQQTGVDGVTLPYLALSGTEDDVAPIDVTRTAIDRLPGVKGQVALNGFGHELNLPTGDDIVTWTLTFLSAWVDGDANAKSQLETMQSVTGGIDDQKVVYSGGTPVSVANYSGLWWNPAESGWGINLAHQGDLVYLSWFTYDAAGKAWWLSMAAGKNAQGAYTGNIDSYRGPAFSATPFNPALVTTTPVGSGTLTFSNANNGSFTYTVNGVTQTKAITTSVFASPVPTCTFSAQANLAAATNYQDIWWAAPAGSESGWGVNFTHQGEVIYATWFTYDVDGSPLWLSAAATRTSPSVYTGTLSRYTGPAFSAVPWLPANVVATPVGTLTLTFANGNSATYAYTVSLSGPGSAVTQSKPITRTVFVPSGGTICQ
jgi:hypothetical protein